MSKLWAVHPIYIDDSRLLREHQSVHKLIQDAARPASKNTQQRFRYYGGYLIWRHYLDASEMRLRGMGHESFVDDLWKRIPEKRRLIRYVYPKETIIKDIKRLTAKMHDARTRYGTIGRAVLPSSGKVPNELNEQIEKVAQEGFPKDVFFV